MNDNVAIDNLRYYIASMDPPKEACKPFKREGGFSGTDISAMWRIKKLTELFGPCGVGWYTEVTKREIIPFDVAHQKAFVDINLYIWDDDLGDWSKPIQGTGGNDFVKKRKDGSIVVNDECFKMAETDALGSACKKLGFGASVYWEQDPTKYTIDDNGQCFEVVATEAELKQAKAEERKKKADSFLKRPEPTESDFQTADKIESRTDAEWEFIAAECMTAICKWVEEDPANNGNHEIIRFYTQRSGPITDWEPGLKIQCYKELKADGAKLQEVAL